MVNVAVLDYGFGNVRSAVRALEHVGATVSLTSAYDEAFNSDGLVVPGVGAFSTVLDSLNAGFPGAVPCSEFALECR